MPNAHRPWIPFAIGLCAAALAALFTVLFAGEEIIARLRAAWQLPAVAIKTPSKGGLPLAELLERSQLLPGLDATPERLGSWRKESAIRAEPFRDLARGLPIDWYRSYVAKLPDHTPIRLLSVSTVFPFAVSPYWLEIEPVVRERWLADPAALLVREDVLHAQHWHVGDVLRVTEAGMPLELHITGVYRGRMPRFALVHFDYLNARLHDATKDTAQMVAVPCVPERCDQLMSALLAETLPSHIGLVAEPGGPGSSIEETRQGTRALRLLAPGALLVLAIALTLLRERERPHYVPLVAGVVCGELLVVAWAHAHDGLPLGAWAYAWAPLSALSIGGGALSALVFGVLAQARPRGARADALLLAIAYFVATTTGAAALAFRTGLSSQLKGAPTHALAMVQTSSRQGVDVVALADAVARMPDVEHEGATPLVARELFANVPRFAGGAVETYTLRGVDALAPELHAPVELENWPRGAVPDDAVWMSDALLQRFGRHVGDDFPLLGHHLRIAGRLRASGLSYESEVWCSNTLLDRLLGVDVGNNLVLAVRAGRIAALGDAIHALPGHLSLDDDAEERADAEQSVIDELAHPWGRLVLAVLFGALVLASASSSRRGALIAMVGAALGLVFVALAYCGRPLYCSNLLVRPQLSAHDVLLVLGSVVLAFASSRIVHPIAGREI